MWYLILLLMIIKKILSFTASIISVFILFLLFLSNSNSDENNSKYYSDDSGILSLMYHRFNENKYPSTNIRMNIFKEQINTHKKLNYKFYNPKYFIDKFSELKEERNFN